MLHIWRGRSRPTTWISVAAFLIISVVLIVLIATAKPASAQPTANTFDLGDISVDTKLTVESVDLVSAFAQDGSSPLVATSLAFGSPTINGAASSLADIGFVYAPGSSRAGAFMIDGTAAGFAGLTSGGQAAVIVPYTVTDSGGLSAMGELRLDILDVPGPDSLTIRDEGPDVPGQGVTASVTAASGELVFETVIAGPASLSEVVNIAPGGVSVASTATEVANAAAADGSTAEATAQDGASANATAQENSSATANAVQDSIANAAAVGASAASADASNGSDATSFAELGSNATASADNNSDAAASAVDASTANTVATNQSVTAASAAGMSVANSAASDDSTAGADALQESIANASAVAASTASADASDGSNATSFAELRSVSTASADNNSTASAPAFSCSSAAAEADTASDAVSTAELMSTSSASASAGGRAEADAQGIPANEIAVVEGPSVASATLRSAGVGAGAITLTIVDAASLDQLLLADFPVGSTFSAGTASGPSAWVVPAPVPATLIMKPPADHAGPVTLATSTQNPSGMVEARVLTGVGPNQTTCAPLPAPAPAQPEAPDPFTNAPDAPDGPLGFGTSGPAIDAIPVRIGDSVEPSLPTPAVASAPAPPSAAASTTDADGAAPELAHSGAETEALGMLGLLTVGLGCSAIATSRMASRTRILR